MAASSALATTLDSSSCARVTSVRRCGFDIPLRGPDAERDADGVA
ncbi:MAG: hypothetical protein ACK55I_48880 [bacterium]